MQYSVVEVDQSNGYQAGYQQSEHCPLKRELVGEVAEERLAHNRFLS